MKAAILTNNSINCYGYRVLTEGIDLSVYEKNPVLLWMHRRDGDFLPIGKMTDLHIEGDALIGTPEFDMEDEFAAEVARKWEAGIIKCCSIGIQVLGVSEEKNDLVAGQIRPTVTKSLLYEVSIVDVGANFDAIQLSMDGAAYELPKLNDIIMTERILTALGFNAEASIDDALTRIEELKAKETALQAKEEAEKQAELAAIIDGAITDGKIDATDKEYYLSLAGELGKERIAELIGKMYSKASTSEIPAARPSAFLAGGQKNSGKKWRDYTIEELVALKESDEALYNALYKEEYGEGL